MATTTPTFTKTGAKATTAVKLDEGVFSFMPTNHALLKLAYDAYLANGRDNLAKTKTRGLVRGGGKKPWRQKGTGRARFGSSRNPIWRGGGVAFGPTGQENYTKNINRKAKRTAIRQALSMAAHDGKLRVIEAFECKNGKTSEAIELLAKIDAKNRILLVANHKNDASVRATQNIPNFKIVQVNYLNVFDTLNADTIVFEKETLGTLSEWLAASGKTTTKEKTNE